MVDSDMIKNGLNKKLESRTEGRYTKDSFSYENHAKYFCTEEIRLPQCLLWFRGGTSHVHRETWEADENQFIESKSKYSSDSLCVPVTRSEDMLRTEAVCYWN